MEEKRSTDGNNDVSDTISDGKGNSGKTNNSGAGDTDDKERGQNGILRPNEDASRKLEDGNDKETRYKGPRHIAIVGMPGSGKTYFSVHNLFKRSEYSVFINLGHEDILGDDPDYFLGELVLDEPDEAIKYLFDGKRCVWNGNPWEVNDFIDKIIRIQRSLPEKPPITIFVDEAHLVAPKGSINLAEKPSPIGLVATNGRRWNIMVVWITQRPQLLDTTIYRLSGYKFFFKLSPEDMEYFHKLGYDLEEKERFEWEARET